MNPRLLIIFLSLCSSAFAEQSCNLSAPNKDTIVHYAISGYWVMGDFDACGWQNQLQQIKELGGDTIIQFGAALLPRSAEEVASDAIFKECREGGKNCIEQAKNDIEALPGEQSIRNIYTWMTSTIPGNRFIRCPALERKIEMNNHLFWRLLIPATDGIANPCENTDNDFDVVLVVASKTDSIQALFDRATVFDMQVFVGMPVIPRKPSARWEVDDSARITTLALSERLFSDLAQRFADNSAWQGLYQSFETPIIHNPIRSVMKFYSAQHKLAKSILKNKKILISPYAVALTYSTGHFDQPSDIEEGIQKIIATGIDIIAPQDGGGTGKIGRYYTNESGQLVEPRLRKLLGEVTYANAYHYSTADLYKAALLGINDSGLNIALWANIEAFNPMPDKIHSCNGEYRTRTSKGDLDKGIELAAPYVKKIISYKWNPFFTCTANETASLADAIKSAK